MEVINSWEFLNLLLAVFFVLIVQGRKNADILLFLFIYWTFHFTFAAIPLLTGESFERILEIHTIGGGILAKMSGTLVIFFTAYQLLNKHFCEFSFQKYPPNINLFFFSSLVIFIGYILKLGWMDWVQFKNFLALIFILCIFFITPRKHNSFFIWKNNITQALLVLLLLLMLIIAIYEVYSHRSWSYFVDSSGNIIYRASALLFNPNLYGVWAAMLAIGFSYIIQSEQRVNSITLFGLILSISNLYFTGSRSVVFLLLFLLIAIGTFANQISTWRRWLPTTLIIFVFVVFGSTSLIFSSFFESQDGWYSVYLLGQRFLYTPIYAFKYVSKFDVPPEVAISIDGRFDGEPKDSGWLVLYDDAGWIGISLFFGLCLMAFILNIRKYLIEPSISSIYSLATLIFSVGIGAVMRFQVYPTGVFIAIMLFISSLSWFDNRKIKPV